MAKLIHSGPVPAAVRVDLRVVTARDPAVAEWLWRQPRRAALRIRELIRAQVFAERGYLPTASDPYLTAVREPREAVPAPAHAPAQTAASSHATVGQGGAPAPRPPRTPEQYAEARRVPEELRNRIRDQQ